jgi:hypothetical protein
MKPASGNDRARIFLSVFTYCVHQFAWVQREGQGGRNSSDTHCAHTHVDTSKRTHTKFFTSRSDLFRSELFVSQLQRRA